MPDDAFLPAVDLPHVDGLVFRHLRVPSDYPQMNAIANAGRRASGDSFVTTVGDMSEFYSHLSNCDPARDVLIVEVMSTIVGYGRCAWYDQVAGGRIHEVICFLDPAWTRRGIGRAMLRTIEARAREVASHQPNAERRFFQAEVQDAAVGQKTLLEQEGYEAVRFGYGMVRPTLDDQPDTPLPEGLEIREVRPEHMRAIWEAETEAFRDHWGAGVTTEADYQNFLTDRIQGDTSLWRVAWDGGQIAGMVRSYINDEENRVYGRSRGWVENISVRRPWRRRGLARALMAASFPLLRARGMTEGALGVDTENASGALRLYESVGFRVVSRDAYYRKPFEATDR